MKTMLHKLIILCFLFTGLSALAEVNSAESGSNPVFDSYHGDPSKAAAEPIAPNFSPEGCATCQGSATPGSITGVKSKPAELINTGAGEEPGVKKGSK